MTQHLDASKQSLAENDFPQAVDALILAGRDLSILDEHERARNEFRQAYGLSKAHSYAAGRLESLCELAVQDVYSGHLLRAKAYLNEAEAFRNVDLPRHEALFYFAGAEYLYFDREIPEAVKNLKLAVELARKANGGDDEARYLRHLGYAYLAKEDPENSFGSIRRSLELGESLDNKREIAFSYIALGFALANYASSDEALNAYKRAESLFPADLDALDKASMYNGIGRIYEDLGDWRLSLDYRERARSLYSENGNKFGVAATLSSIARLYSLVYPENTEIAVKNFLDAQDYAVSIGDKFYSSLTLVELGNYYLRVDNTSQASKYYRRSYAYFESKKDKRVMADIKAKLSQILLSQGRSGPARQALTEALELNVAIADRFAEAQDLALLANLELFEGNEDSAMELARGSLIRTEDLYFDVNSSDLRRSYLSSVYERYQLFQNLLMRKFRATGDVALPAEAFVANEKWRSRSLLERLRLSGTNFSKDADPEAIATEKQLAASISIKSNRLTELISASGETDETALLEREIRGLHEQLEDLRTNFKVQSPIYWMMTNPDSGNIIADLQHEILDENSVLLEFSLGQDESYLWVISTNSVDVFYLPPKASIDGRVEKLRALLRSRDILPDESIENFQRRVVDSEIAYKSEIRTLSMELLGQAVDKIGGKRLIVVPDGKLQYFPVGALPWPNAESDEPILAKNEIVYVPSATALKVIVSASNAVPGPKEDLLAFADPVFSRSDERLATRDDQQASTLQNIVGTFRGIGSLDSLQRLPASEEEARSIADVIGGRTTVRSGFAANRATALGPDVLDYKILHFATHGLIDEKRPELSGIVLSLYDKDGSTQEGGFIRLPDVYGLNLNTDLVVLSACETGIGKDVRGEGVMSLNNAFLQAGAKSVVSSLWKVDDNATKELMTEFYRGIADSGLSASEALRRAQLKIKGDPRYSSPFYWAAFTAHGDFNRVPQISKPFFRWQFAVAVIPPIVIVFLLICRRRRGRSIQ